MQCVCIKSAAISAQAWLPNDEPGGQCLTSKRVAHVEGIPQEKGARPVDGSRRHELVLHAADAAGLDGLHEGTAQLLGHLRSDIGAQVLRQLARQPLARHIHQAPHLAHPHEHTQISFTRSC